VKNGAEGRFMGACQGPGASEGGLGGAGKGVATRKSISLGLTGENRVGTARSPR